MKTAEQWEWWYERQVVDLRFSIAFSRASVDLAALHVQILMGIGFAMEFSRLAPLVICFAGAAGYAVSAYREAKKA